MTTASRIIVISREQPSLLGEMVGDRGVDLIEVRVCHEVPNALDPKLKCLVVLELSNKLSTLKEQLKEFEYSPSMREVPLLVLGPKTNDVNYTQRIRALNQSARIIPWGANNTLTTSDLQQILKGLGGTWEEVDSGAGRHHNTFSTLPESHIHYSLAALTKRLGLGFIQLGGDEFPLLYETNLIQAHKILPSDQMLAEAIREKLNTVPQWEKAHLRRVAFMVRSIISALRLPEATIDISTALSYLYLWPDDSHTYHLIRTPYTREGQEQRLQEVAQALMHSSNHIRRLIDDEAIAASTGIMAALLLKDQPDHEQEFFTIASTILFSDIVGRECFTEQYFSSRSAHHILRWIEKGNTSMFASEAIALGTHFLMEAVEATPPRIPGPAMHEAQDSMTPLRFTHLQQGMRLAAPLKTLTGLKILEQGTMLDSDLIWRIWRTSTLTPLAVPLIENSPHLPTQPI